MIMKVWKQAWLQKFKGENSDSVAMISETGICSPAFLFCLFLDSRKKFFKIWRKAFPVDVIQFDCV